MNEQIARQIRAYRKERNMTLTDLSAKTDVDDTYLGRVERGEINITLNTLEKIISGLSMTNSEFFAFLEIEERQPDLYSLSQDINASPERDKIIELIKGILNLYQN